jgi:hypothetical protein
MAAAIREQFAGIVSEFKKDSTKENAGVWMTYGKHQFLVARSHRDNAKFFALMERELRPFQWAIDRGNFAAIKDAADEVMQKVYSETILLGIRKLDGDGAGVHARGWHVALFKELPDLWDEIFKFSNNGGNYAPDAVEQDSKN